MGITGLLPFIEKASRRANVSEFSGCTVAIDSYCWLHKGAFACAEKLVRGEDTDVHIKYCLKYVTMLLSRNIKPILVFDGQHLPAKALTEAKRRESRNISKKRAAELLTLGQTEEARSYMRRSVDITHSMALALIKECRRRNVDCIVAPYEADSQLAFLNVKNIAQLVITEDSDLILFGCTKVLFKMDLDGSGTLVETAKLPLVMRCPIERYSLDKFRQMCIMAGCDYLASLPGIGLAKARQFLVATRDDNIANALKKLSSFFNKSSLSVTDEYRENFLKAEATFKHQYVYDPLERRMLRLNEPEDEDIEKALCCNAGEVIEPDVAFQLALGNLDPFTLKQLDDWHPDRRNPTEKLKTDSWDHRPATHTSIWSPTFKVHLAETSPWKKKARKLQSAICIPTTRRKAVNLVNKVVPETQDQSLTIESLSNMYCVEPATKRQKTEDSQDSQDDINPHDKAMIKDDKTDLSTELKEKSPILENKERGFMKCLRSTNNNSLKRFSKFPRTVLDDNVVESKFFSTSDDAEPILIEDSPLKTELRKTSSESSGFVEDSQRSMIPDSQSLYQKENSPKKCPKVSPRTESRSKNPFRVRPLEELTQTLESTPTLDSTLSQDSVIENTYPMETLVTPVDSQESFGEAVIYRPSTSLWRSRLDRSSSPPPPPPTPPPPPPASQPVKKPQCRVPGLRRPASLPSNQPTLLSKFGFQKRPAMKK